ncbi:glycosyltransferase family 4 protein [Citricoccus zhacaiensis]
MRIALILKTNTGGMWAVPQLLELRRRGHDVVAVLPSGDGRLRHRLDDLRIPVQEIDYDFRLREPLDLVRAIRILRRLLRRLDVDVAFYHLIQSAILARLSTAGMRLARVHMVAGPLYLESPSIAWFEARLTRLDHRIIAGSDYTRNKYAAIGTKPDRLVSIPYGVDTEWFSPGPNRREELLGVGPGTFVAIMVAYVYAPKSAVFPNTGIKGHDTLLRAWEQFAAERDDIQLVLVGSGFGEDGEKHRQRLIEEFDVRGSQTVTWFDTVEDVRGIYSSADISIAPSLSENHGSALESSSMGLPAIVSDAGALPEAVTSETGWIVPRGSVDHLAAALREANDEHRAGTLSQRGRAARARMTTDFELSDCVARVADVIEETASSLDRQA